MIFVILLVTLKICFLFPSFDNSILSISLPVFNFLLLFIRMTFCGNNLHFKYYIPAEDLQTADSIEHCKGTHLDLHRWHWTAPKEICVFMFVTFVKNLTKNTKNKPLLDFVAGFGYSRERSHCCPCWLVFCCIFSQISISWYATAVMTHNIMYETFN